jgi:hypothetical protein
VHLHIGKNVSIVKILVETMTLYAMVPDATGHINKQPNRGVDGLHEVTFENKLREFVN